MKNRTVIIDNGHGIDTAGKRSPNGEFREYLWCRDFAKMLKYNLEYFGYTPILLVPEDEDICLSERARRANEIYNNCNKYFAIFNDKRFPKTKILKSFRYNYLLIILKINLT